MIPLGYVNDLPNGLRLVDGKLEVFL